MANGGGQAVGDAEEEISEDPDHLQRLLIELLASVLFDFKLMVRHEISV